MANIATCPKCAKQLELSAVPGPTDRAECPECQAIFLLREAVQVSLPLARVLSPEEPEPVAEVQAEASVPQPADLEVDAILAKKELRENVPTVNQPESCSDELPRPSWEERLKRALALDSSQDDEQDSPAEPTAPSDPEPVLQTSEVTPGQTDSPSFEFQLDPAPASAAEFARQPLGLELPATLFADAEEPSTAEADQEISPPKTLADFAASLGSAALEESSEPATEPTLDDSKNFKSTMPVGIAGPLGLKRNTPARKSTPHAPRAKNLPTTKASPALEPKSKAIRPPSKPVEDKSKAFAGRRLAKAGFPKVAAFVVGPIAGSLLGLYGLLWIQGEKADHIRLSRVLPASVLPVSFSEASHTEANSPAYELLTASKNKQPTMKRDESVMQVLATQTVAQTGITSAEFVALVNAAQRALPEFVVGDLSTQESIKRKGQAYIELCRLAEHMSFATQPGLASTVQAKAELAAQLFIDATAQDGALHDLAHIAGRWWEYEQRPCAGIFLTGQIQRTQPVANGTLCWVQLDDVTTVAPLPVLFKHERYRDGEFVGVVGRLITTPSGLRQDLASPRLVQVNDDFAL